MDKGEKNLSSCLGFGDSLKQGMPRLPRGRFPGFRTWVLLWVMSCLSFEGCSMILWQGSMCCVREIHLDVVLLNLRMGWLAVSTRYILQCITQVPFLSQVLNCPVGKKNPKAGNENCLYNITLAGVGAPASRSGVEHSLRRCHHVQCLWHEVLVLLVSKRSRLGKPEGAQLPCTPCTPKLSPAQRRLTDHCTVTSQNPLSLNNIQ